MTIQKLFPISIFTFFFITQTLAPMQCNACNIIHFFQYLESWYRDYDDRNYKLCGEACEKLLIALRNSDLKNDGFRFPKEICDFPNFRVEVPEHSNLYKMGFAYISQLVPIDAFGNRLTDGISKEKLPSIYELALIDQNGEISYSHPLCENVLRVNSYEDLIKLYKKLLNYLPSGDVVINSPKIERDILLRRGNQRASGTSLSHLF